MQRLQSVLSALPDIVSAGCLSFDRSDWISSVFAMRGSEGLGRNEFNKLICEITSGRSFRLLAIESLGRLCRTKAGDTVAPSPWRNDIMGLSKWRCATGMSKPNMKHADASSVIWKYAWQGRRAAQLLLDMAFGGRG